MSAISCTTQEQVYIWSGWTEAAPRRAPTTLRSGPSQSLMSPLPPPLPLSELERFLAEKQERYRVQWL